ncbi:uncharacterized protein RAG0_08462 [Rhynchosporium agropyri]|uniref:Yeast cell wall synthesis Kre9/Knh1-like N-terminal domain-containing protein n=2 Tax=Rhynchosporium TaxID=38037 RepID=A0A1E1KR04_9HELO|nr:uncharacterized protein RCO7_04688 [Rhynchosporium commune]CZT00433.1 uncharacterized protein RAG0_08462 [Rhynchosporium agropyri]
MQFSFTFIAAAALAVVSAKPIIGNGPASFVGVQAGKSFVISWAEASGPVTLSLQNGEGNDLKDVSVIQSGLSGAAGNYTWSIPSTLPSDFYAIKIADSTSVPNYSVLFEITGGPSTSASSSASSSASGSSTSTRSSASTSATGASNSTITSSSSSSSRTGSATSTGTASRTATSSSGSSPTSSGTAPPNSNSGASIASPLAFVLLSFAALITLN